MVLEWRRGTYLSGGPASPTIEHLRPITSTSLKRKLARCPMSRTSTGPTAAVESSAAMTIGRRSIGELPKRGEPRAEPSGSLDLRSAYRGQHGVYGHGTRTPHSVWKRKNAIIPSLCEAAGRRVLC